MGDRGSRTLSTPNNKAALAFRRFAQPTAVRVQAVARCDLAVLRGYALRMSVAFGCVASASCTLYPAPSQASATDAAKSRSRRVMPDVANDSSQPPARRSAATDASQPALGAYLRAMADALAAPGATADAVLGAARARDIRRGRDFARFRLPDPRLTGDLELARAADPRPEPGPVTLEADSGQARVKLAEVAAAFGAWAPGDQATSLAPLWRVVFTSPYRAPGPARPGAGVVKVVADLSAPDLAGGVPSAETRVVRIILQRDADEGQ